MVTWHKPGAIPVLLGGLLYLAGTFRVTIVFNVPRNDALAAVDPASTDGASLWVGYVTSWTVWNHVRTAAALAAAALTHRALRATRRGSGRSRKGRGFPPMLADGARPGGPAPSSIGPSV